MRIFSRLPVMVALMFCMQSTLSVPMAQAVTFKIATLSPDGSMWMKQMRAGAAEIKERTEGRVEFKFYPGGVMGDDKAVLRKIRSRQLHGAVLTAGGVNQIYTDLQVYSLPMIFASLEEADYVRARVDEELMSGLRESGFVGFGIAEVGFAYAMSKTPVLTFEDIRAQKVWIPTGDTGAELAFSTFNINPIPLSIADVFGGLQTGLINSVAVPPVGAIALQWHTQLKNVFDLPLMYVYGLLMVKNSQFDQLEAQDQVIVSELMGGVVQRVDKQNRSDHERAVEALKIQGLTWNQPTASEAQRWQGLADDATSEMVSRGVVSQGLLDTVKAHIAVYREGLD